MTDTLRTRIAEAARRANTGLFGDGPADDWYEIADAVIADLGLEHVISVAKQWLSEMKDCDGHCDCRGHDDLTIIDMEMALQNLTGPAQPELPGSPP